MKRPAISLSDSDPVFLPVGIRTLSVTSREGLAALDQANIGDSEVVLLHGDCPVASRFLVERRTDVPDGVLTRLRGVSRVEVVDREQNGDGAWVAEVEPVEPDAGGEQARDLIETVVRAMVADPKRTDEAVAPYQSELPLDTLVDAAAFDAELDRELQLQMLAEIDVDKRAAIALPYWSRIAEEKEALDAGPRPGPPAPDDNLGRFPETPEAQLSWLLTRLCREARLPPSKLEAVLAPQLKGWLDEDPSRIERVRSAIDQAVEEKRALETSWPKTTITDRLLGGLASLRGIGLLVSKGEWLTRSDAEDDLQAQLEADEMARGWVMYTQQDVEMAINGHGIQLGFHGAGDLSDTDVADMVIATLEGLEVPTWWPHDPDIRIVVPIPWRRRMPQ